MTIFDVLIPCERLILRRAAEAALERGKSLELETILKELLDEI